MPDSFNVNDIDSRVCACVCLGERAEWAASETARLHLGVTRGVELGRWPTMGPLLATYKTFPSATNGNKMQIIRALERFVRAAVAGHLQRLGLDDHFCLRVVFLFVGFPMWPLCLLVCV